VCDDEAAGDLSGQASVSPKKPIPEEIDHREIAVRVPVVSEVEFLLAPKPCKTPKARSLHVVFLIKKNMDVERC
jgi:hypothetical protein